MTDVRGWRSDRHRAYNTTDIQACDVPDVEAFVRSTIEQRVFPEFARRYFGAVLATGPQQPSQQHKQQTGASESKGGGSGAGVGDAKQTSFGQSGSSVTGSGGSGGSWVRMRFRDLFFVKYEAARGEQSGLDLHRDGSIVSFNILLNPRSEFDGGGTYFEAADRTCEIEQGDCLLHSGQLRHAGREVTRGVRFILVGFVDVVGPPVDALIRAACDKAAAAASAASPSSGSSPAGSVGGAGAGSASGLVSEIKTSAS